MVQLWDVCTDQEAVDLVRNIQDPVAAAKLLVDHALSRFSTDNLSCMIIRLDRNGLLEKLDKFIGVEGDQSVSAGKPSEADKIVSSMKQKIAEGGALAIGVSASNSGRGHDPIPIDSGEVTFKPTTIEGPVEEEPSSMSDDSPESTPTMETEPPRSPES